MADDRRDRRTPRGGFGVPLFVEPDEDKTPVTSDPFVRLEFHQHRMEKRQDLALGEIKALHQKLDDTIKHHDQAQDRDEKEHRRLSESISRIAQESAGTRARVDTLGDQLDKTAVAVREVAKEQASVTAQLTKDQATVTAQLGLALEDLRTIKQIDAHEKKVIIETEALVRRTETETDAIVRRSQTQDLVAGNDAKRKQRDKILQIVGAALGTGGIITAIVLAALQAKC